MIGGPETAQARTGMPPDLAAMDMPGAPPILAEEQVDLGWEEPVSALPQLMADDGRGIPLDMVRMPGPNRMEPRDINPAAPLQPGQPLPGGATVADGPMPEQQDPRGFRERSQRIPTARVSAPRFNQNYRYTQEDFYGQQHPISWTDPRGVQMHVPEAGRLPMAIAASRMQQNQKELADVRKAKQDLIKSWEVKPTADPYQPSFQKLLRDMRGSFVQGIAEQYGGNEDMAWNDIVNDPETMAQFEELHQEAEAIGQYGKFIWDEAKGYLERAATGKYAIDPDVRKYAEEVYGGFGKLRGGDGLPQIRQLLNASDKFHRAVSREEFVKQFALPGLKDRYRRWAEYKTKRAGGMNIVEQQKNFSSREFLKEIAQSMVPAIPGSTAEENLKYLENVIPPEHFELEISARNIPTPNSGPGSGNSKSAAAATVDYTPMPKELFTQGGTRTPGPGTELTYPTLNLVDVVSDQGRTPQPREFRTRGKETRFMHPTRIMNVNGQLFIVGKKTGQQRTEALDGADGGAPMNAAQMAAAFNGGGEGGVPAMDSQTFNKLPDVIVPYDGNQGLIESYFGMNDAAVKQKLDWKAGQKNGRKEAGAFATDESAYEDGEAPTKGAVMDGYKFKGGDPGDPNNWVKQ